MEREALASTDETMRLLAAAANAARLYPPTSELPAQAVDGFVSYSNAVTVSIGQLRFTVDPHGFRIGDADVAPGVSHVTQLAEALHAMQAGQLIIAPDLTAAEVRAFIQVANTEPLQIRQSDGLRHALGRAGVSHIGIVEVSLRASEEEGLLGVDLTSAPLEEIAEETAAAAERWARDAPDGEARDEMDEALGRLEDATRELAKQRIAQALLRLDEVTRERVLAAALVPGPDGARMSGMLDVIARMNPASLARLIAMTAERLNAAPDPLAAAMDLPPEIMEQVMLLLRPAPRTEADCGVPADVDAAVMATEVSAIEDSSDLERQIAMSAPSLASGRGLKTAVQVSRAHPDEESVKTIGNVLPDAARDGALVEVREALRRLDELRDDPALTEQADRARGSLADPGLLRDLCRTPLTDADAAVAGEIISAAGAAGAQALLECYVETDEFRRSLMRPVLRGMSDQVLGVAGRMLRSADVPTAQAVLGTLAALGDRRAIPVIASTLENMDSSVRRTALTALADTRTEDGVGALIKAIAHWDPSTRRHAAQELGRIRAVSALPQLMRVLDEIELFERNYELKKEVIQSLVAIGSPKAIPTLKRVATVGLPFGRKRKELRFLARNAMAELAEAEHEGR